MTSPYRGSKPGPREELGSYLASAMESARDGSLSATGEIMALEGARVYCRRNGIPFPEEAAATILKTAVEALIETAEGKAKSGWSPEYAHNNLFAARGLAARYGIQFPEDRAKSIMQLAVDRTVEGARKEATGAAFPYWGVEKNLNHARSYAALYGLEFSEDEAQGITAALWRYAAERTLKDAESASGRGLPSTLDFDFEQARIYAWKVPLTQEEMQALEARIEQIRSGAVDAVRAQLG